MTNRRGVLVGGGAFAREALAWALDLSRTGGSIGISWKAFLDSDSGSLGKFDDLALDWLGDPADFEPSPDDVLLMAIGDPKRKSALMDRFLERGDRLETLIHPSAVIAHSAKIGRGVVVGPHAYVATHATLADGVCVNSLTGIGHDAVVGNCATISSQVDITGEVTLGARVFIGSGARVLPGVSVGDDAKVGAGAIVVRNVKSLATVFAQPARTM